MEKHLKTAHNIADLLDSKFKVLGFRFGIDPILGLIPGAGDVVSVALSSYIIWLGVEMQLPKKKVAEMIKNTTLDFLIGLVPVLGDIADFAFKSNVKNLNLIRDQLSKDKLRTGKTIGLK